MVASVRLCHQIEICTNTGATRQTVFITAQQIRTASFTYDAICKYLFENVHLEDPEGDGRITLR